MSTIRSVKDATVDRKAHWEQVYRTNDPDRVSWFEPEATSSLQLIQLVAPARDSAIIDVGGGASMLAEGLVAAGYERIDVLDLSAAALAQARRRLGDAGESVQWLEADVLGAELPAASFDVWHDRAVFHFLTQAADRAAYVTQVRHAVRPGGFVVMATFAAEGPAKCSGLEVMRYSPERLHEELGDDFRMVESRHEEHVTPSGAQQAFTYCAFRYEPDARTRARHAGDRRS